MSSSLFDKVILALKQAARHNSSVMTRPEVILWPDPEQQWMEVIPQLQESLPQLLIYGPFDPVRKAGPAIWLKAMVARRLPAADWPDDKIPVIYLPGVTKSDLRNVENAVFNLQPLLEYQYTGVLFLQENGREWTIRSFIENPLHGLGIRVAADNATREAMQKSLPTWFRDADIFQGKSLVDAGFLNNLVFPNIGSAILNWMCQGEKYLKQLDEGKRETFKALCLSQFDFEPDHRNIKSIAEKLGAQKGAWKSLWDLYATAPRKYPELEEWLRKAKPDDLGTGMYSLPEESWPQVNEQKEKALHQELVKLGGLDAPKALQRLQELEKIHGPRRSWVWHELGQSPLASCLLHLSEMALVATEPYPFQSTEALQEYYTTKGFKVDLAMRKGYEKARSVSDKEVVAGVIRLLYQPWLETLTNRFQKLVENNAGIFATQDPLEENDSYILFVDAFRYEMATEFIGKLENTGWKTEFSAIWTAIPTVTPTAKPAVAPLASRVSMQSDIDEFRPQTAEGKDLSTTVFRDALSRSGYQYIASAKEIKGDGKYWQEIGDIDSKGHSDQSDMVHSVNQLFRQVQDIVSSAFEKGIKRVKIVTDHGWLLLPGGLPKTSLNAGLVETRWGRCALIKPGAPSKLLHLPWRWNPAVYIAYAPGISFFKANVDYAHGGISLQECLVPVLNIEKPSYVGSDAEITSAKWVRLKCTVGTNDVPDGFKADIRLKHTDAGTSILEGDPKSIENNSVTLMVKDDYEGQAATIVLMDKNNVVLDSRLTTVGGK